MSRALPRCGVTGQAGLTVTCAEMADDPAARVAPLPREPKTRPLTKAYLIAEIRLWAKYHDGRAPRYADWNRARARRHGIVFETGWPSTQPVEDCFGSWRAGLEAAGFTTRTCGGDTRPCLDCGRSTRNPRWCSRCARHIAAVARP